MGCAACRILHQAAEVPLGLGKRRCSSVKSLQRSLLSMGLFCVAAFGLIHGFVAGAAQLNSILCFLCGCKSKGHCRVFDSRATSHVFVEHAPEPLLPWTKIDRAGRDLRSHWFEDAVLAAPLGGPKLARRLFGDCLAMEQSSFSDGSTRRQVSNIGGWQSDDLCRNQNPALQRFAQLLHRPLAAYLSSIMNDKFRFMLHGTTCGSGKGGNAQQQEQQQQVVVSAVLEHFWANVNRPGHWNACHHHGAPTASVLASGVFYPADCEPTAPLRLFPRGRDPVLVTPQAGLLLLFPPDMPHEVDPVPIGAGPRVSLAFNLRVRWLDNPQLRAAMVGNSSELRRLLASDRASFDMGDKILGLRASHIAAEAGHVSAVKTLAASGVADVRAESSEGWSPLSLAAERGHRQVVQYLASESRSLPHQLDSALGQARLRGYGDIVQLLEDLGATRKAGTVSMTSGC